MDLTLFKLKRFETIDKYKENYTQYHKYFRDLEQAIRDLASGKFSVKIAVEIGMAVIQIVWNITKKLPTKERGKFTISVLEYFFEDVLGWDVSDAIWDFLLVLVEQYLSQIIPWYGAGLEKNTPVTFNAQRVYPKKIKKPVGKQR